MSKNNLNEDSLFCTFVDGEVSSLFRVLNRFGCDWRRLLAQKPVFDQP